MPLLGDYLGQLLAEITLARVRADVQTLRVAELYADHPLLRHFPVPHFRLPTVSLELPVAIRDAPELGGQLNGRVDLVRFRNHFTQLLTEHLRRVGLSLSGEAHASMNRRLDEAVKRLDRPVDISVGAAEVAEEFVAAALVALREPPLNESETERLNNLAEALRRDVRAAFVKAQPPNARLEVLVTSAQLREAGPRELMTRVQLSITEEAMEWTTIESAGKSTDRLVPE